MVLTCPRCSRSNPTEALFCYNDGIALGDPARRQANGTGNGRFPMPFVFPTGKSCHSFDELALGVQERWDESRNLLKHGVFSGFFAGLGRGDLALAAREMAKLPDGDRALDELLQHFPTSVLAPPRLEVEPLQVNLGTLRVGQDARFDLHLSNGGMGLLTGTIVCEGAPWLVIGGEGARSREKVFQILHEASIPIRVRGQSLTANNKPQTARLLIDSNGGRVEVPVTLDLPVIPFAEGVLAGAVTPRQIAQKAREHPKEAAVLFARGAVARWYELNGMTYPVLDPSASGIAAVQQFFEALGLTEPPQVKVSVNALQLEGKGGDILRTSLQVVAQEKKPVFAHVTSDQPWLTVDEVALDGRTATVHLRVSEVPDRPNETLQAKINVTANGRKRFVVPVSLRVTGPTPWAMKYPPRVGGWQEVPTLEPVAEPSPRRVETLEEVPPREASYHEAPPYARAAPVPPEVLPVEDAPPQPKGTRYGLAGLPVLFLALGLLVTLVRDLATWFSGGPPNAVPGMEELAGLPQDLHVHFHDRVVDVTLTSTGMKPPGQENEPGIPARWDPTMRFGLVMAGPGGVGDRKRLTLHPAGLTNNTVVRLDHRDHIFGDQPFVVSDGRPAERWAGRWLEREGQPKRPMRDGRRSVWVYDDEKVTVTQTVGLVPGAQSGKIDTCLIEYEMENRDQNVHTVGVRFLLDTFIGSNDGVPYLIPTSPPRLCNTDYRFNTPGEVPDYIQARETEDLARPGTIALIQFKNLGYEVPSRVTLGAWPNKALGAPCDQEKTPWDFPTYSMKTLPKPDSAVTVYWDPQPLRPGEKRTVGFAYGLGRVAASEAGGALGLSVGGSFTPGGEFSLTAEVRNPVRGQTLTLELPPGFSLVSGRTTEAVPPPAANLSARISPVTWRIKAGPNTGAFPLRVQSSTGVAQKLEVQIKVRTIFGN